MPWPARSAGCSPTPAWWRGCARPDTGAAWSTPRRASSRRSRRSTVTASRRPGDERRTRVLVVGSGWHFLSGISYYTCRLSNALSERYEVGAILMRRLLPRRLYPGRVRVGKRLSDLRYAPGVRVFDGIDWFGPPSLLAAVRFLRRFRPDVLVLQWWTGTVLHSYLVLCLVARLAGVRVVIEFHEVQDT